jgi:hypothetical protein
MIPCEVFPKRNATLEQLKRLGEILSDYVHESPFDGADITRWEQDAIDDLLVGGLPQPALIRASCLERNRSTGILPEDGELSTAEKATFNTEIVQKGRTVAFCVVAETDDYFGPLAESLKAAIPTELVTNVTINGESWRAEE